MDASATLKFLCNNQALHSGSTSLSTNAKDIILPLQQLRQSLNAIIDFVFVLIEKNTGAPNYSDPFDVAYSTKSSAQEGKGLVAGDLKLQKINLSTCVISTFLGQILQIYWG